MKRLAALIAVLAIGTVAVASDPKQASAADCQFVLGFQSLQQTIPAEVGNCVTNVRYNASSGDATQATTGRTGSGGLLVWRKFDNFTAFTDGFRTWINGPFGLQVRLNTQRFFWEWNPDGLPVVPPPVEGDRCNTAELSIALQDVEHGVNHFVGDFVLTNSTSVSCTLFGFPGLQLLDSHNDSLPTNAVPRGGDLASLPGPSLVTLPPGGSASFKVHWENLPASDETACPTSSFLKVTPPGEIDALIIQIGITVCGGGRLDVSAVAVSAEVSNNWSGFAASGGVFTAVSGTWIVPLSRSVGVPAASATWVGIGGLISRDLIQAGTEAIDNDGTGSIEYDAWIELLPAPPTTVPLGVKPGDSITVVIAQTSPGRWRLTLRNNTTVQSFETSVSYNSSLSSADWIQEAPSTRRRILPLDNFGTVQFSGGSTVKDGQTLSIAQAGGRPIRMIDASGDTIAVPGSLTADGSGFSVTRSAP